MSPACHIYFLAKSRVPKVTWKFPWASLSDQVWMSEGREQGCQVGPEELGPSAPLASQMAFRYLSWILFPLLGCYAIYSLLYLEHKGWYSWVLSMLYGFLLTFGEQAPVVLSTPSWGRRSASIPQPHAGPCWGAPGITSAWPCPPDT